MSPTVLPPLETIADLLHRLGDIPPDRVRYHPFPGTATEVDVLARPDGVKRLFELVDGTLVEKPMGYPESRLAMRIGARLLLYAEANQLGAVAGADGHMRITPGLVRLPDVSFVARERLTADRALEEQIANLAPDLAVEVLSPSNTRAEMARKRREYFAAGTRLVWEIDPRARTVDVYTAPDAIIRLSDGDTLAGADVLPGFTMPLTQLFTEPLADARG